MRTPHDILKKPRITEKGSLNAGAVSFEVPLDATKTEIKHAVHKVFNVEVKDIRTAVVRGKIKRRGRFVGKRPNWKKAIVTLKEGYEIDFFGGSTTA